MAKTVPIAFLLGLSSCTHLEVAQYQPNAGAQRPGYAYMLDFTQYQIVLRRTLAACKANELPTIKVEATVTPGLAPDGEQVYVIDPQSMISAFKTSDISVDYKDGRLVGFNVTTVDRTGDFIASVVTTAGKIARLVALPVPANTSLEGYCTQQAQDNLSFIEKNKGPLEAATAQLDDATAHLALLTSQFAVKPTVSLRKQIETLTKSIKSGHDKVDTLTKSITKAQDFLTDTVTITWPQVSTTYHEGPGFPLSVATQGRWFQVDQLRQIGGRAAEAKLASGAGADGKVMIVVSGDGGSAERLGVSPEEFSRRYPLLANTELIPCKAQIACKAQIDAAQDAILDRLIAKAVTASVSFHLVRRGTFGGENHAPGSSHTRDGLRYRVPAAGTLFICDFDEPCYADGPNEPIAHIQGAIAQLGQVFYIPFNSPAFASGGIGVTFDDQGRLLHAQLKRDSSTALGYANAAGAAVDQVAAFKKAQQQATLDDLSRQTQILNARKTLADAQAAQTRTPQQLAADQLLLLQTQQQIQTIQDSMAPSELKDLSKQVEIAKVQADLATARAKLQADPQADLNEIKAQYDAQTAVLNARKSELEAEVALAEAQKKLQPQ